MQEQFWAKVEKGDGCWLFAGRGDKDGYKRMKIKGKTFKAHRLSWELNRGPIPAGLSVLHRCDNPPCVNPDHLFLGTSLDNNQDRAAKGRTSKIGAPRGEANAKAKLTEEQIIKLRSLYHSGEYTQIALAPMFGISHWQVFRIIKSWKHLLMPIRK